MNFYADTVVCYSFSKSLSLAGERIGFAAVNADMEGAKDVFAAISGAARAAGYVCAPTLFQRVCAHSLGKTGELSVYGGNPKIAAGTNKLGFAPSEGGASTSTYYCDSMFLVTTLSGCVPCFGGSRSYGASVGAFYFNCGDSASYANASIGARLCFCG